MAIILADNQTVFRAGAARALERETPGRVVTQCGSAAQLDQALAQAANDTVVLFASAFVNTPAAFDAVISRIRALSGRGILITENGEHTQPEMLEKIDGSVARSISAAELIDCVRRVAQGQRPSASGAARDSQLSDAVGARVRDRLTPKEMQIVALIVQGMKNKEIATQLDTKEQVIKNYLRSIYDKTGVSDRLELALFTIHHRILAEAAAHAGHLIAQKRSS